MFSELSDVSADPGRSPDSHSAGTNQPLDNSRLVCCRVHWRAYSRNEESAFESAQAPIGFGGRESAKVSLVGTAQQPGRQLPLTGNQNRKGLVESEPPERETAR